MLCAQRSRKRTIILSFELRRRSFSNVKIMFFFTFSMVEHSSWRSWRSVRSTKNMQSRVTFPDFSSPLFIYSKSDTTIFWCCGSLRTFVLICYLEFTFHVKHCESNIKFVTIIPVRIKQRKVKKRGIFPLLHHRISFRYLSFSSFQNLLHKRKLKRDQINLPSLGSQHQDKD